MKSTLFAIAKISVTALLFFYLFRKTDIHQFVAILRNARLDILFLAFIVLWLGHYICIYRWRMLMRPLMPPLSLSQLFGIYCIGLFFNLTLPTIVGGDVVKMYYASKPSKLYAQSFAAAFLDRDIGFFAMMLIASIGTLVYPVVVPGMPVMLIVWCAFCAFIAINIGIFSPFFHRLLVSMLTRFSMTKIAVKVDSISTALQIVWQHKWMLFASLLISIINQLAVISVTWIMALGLRLNVSFSHCVIFVPIITLISMIPISFNGMGLRERAYTSLFGGIGLLPASCLALGLMSSIITILTSLPGGIVYIFFRNRNDAQELAAFETEFS